MIRAILAAGIAALSLSSAQAQESAPLTVIHAGQLLAVPGEAPLAEQSVFVRDGRIESVQSGYARPDGAEIIDLTDQFVLPGLIDSHVHLQGELSPNGRLNTVTFSSADNALDAARHARTTLMAGFTSAQEVGGQLEASVALRNAIRDGDVIGPRLRYAPACWAAS